jgi:hypothetical protein
VLKFLSSREPQFKLQGEFKSVQEFQFKESSRYSKDEEKPVDAESSGIGRRGREVGRKTGSRRVKIECALRVV